MPTQKGLLKEAEINELIDNFLAGKTGKLVVPEWLIEHIQSNIIAISGQEFGYELDDMYNPHYETTKKMRKNLVQFSVNKVVHNLNDMEVARRTVGKEQLREKLFKINKKYNYHWLETENRTAGKLSKSARDWSNMNAERKEFPFLEYDAIIDENTRDEHAELDGIIKPIDDGFWDTYYPVNGYNCRCSVNQLDEYDVDKKGGITDLRQKPIQTVNSRMNDAFKHNPGKTGKVFKTTHPYMDRRRRVLDKSQQAYVQKLIKRHE